MLLTQTIDKLHALGLFGMVLGLREQLESNQYLNLSFDERLGLLVDRGGSRLQGTERPGSLGRAQPGTGRLGRRPPQPADHRSNRSRENNVRKRPS